MFEFCDSPFDRLFLSTVKNVIPNVQKIELKHNVIKTSHFDVY